ncbi:MAG: M14 metallopeptidase family protein [Chitinophagaceae bacterium]
MRKALFIFFSSFLFLSLSAQDLSYYLPDSVTYNPAIPKPKDIIYHEVGEWHVTHDRLVNYMKAIAAAAPQRVKLENMGFTYEGRPQVMLIITSPRNHQNLEQIRQQHVQLSDPSASGSINIDNMPAVVWIGHSIHGNESSGANASLVSAYYLAAAQGKQIDDLLDNVVVLFDPSFNPDGLNRFATWVNQHKSKNLVTDPNSREFNEVWPGGRFNHYWFDLNRDWLPAVHIESQNRLKKFHEWKPNILTDHHEMGSGATFFFQPGVPARVNPLTPDKNQELTGQIGKFHAQFLDRIGSLYYTKEGYDDFYYGKGSTYPDVNGAIGILFEQASSRGHAQQTANGVLKFPFTIRNQFTTTLSTLEAARSLRKDLLAFQRDFYKNVMTEAGSATTKAYVFGDAHDRAKTFHFAEMLRRHQIDLYELKSGIKAEGYEFEKGNAYLVPANQSQHRLIRAIFEKTLNYKDSLFYDITSWTMPLAFGLPYAELGAAAFNPGAMGSKVNELSFPKNESALAKSEYAYLLEWDEFYAPAALNELLNKNVLARVTTNPFSVEMNGATKKFSYGTIMIPVQSQSMTSADLYKMIQDVAGRYAVKVHALRSGSAMQGSDLGSNKFAIVPRQQVAMITGPGVNATDAGEVWHLFDQRMNIQLSLLEPTVFNRVDLTKYTTIIMVGGNYPEINKDKLKLWVQSGGNLVLLEDAITWASQNDIAPIKLKRARGASDSSAMLTYTDRENREGAQQMSGAIFRAEADLTHPLAYGYSQPYVSMFKANRVYLDKSRNPYATPFYYKDKPLQSGWLSRENYDAVKNSAAVVVAGSGSGRVIAIADDPNFRAFWMGGTKLMLNAVFFGKIIDPASVRAEED